MPKLAAFASAADNIRFASSSVRLSYDRGMSTSLRAQTLEIEFRDLRLRSLSGPLAQREAVSTGCITLFTTYRPILVPYPSRRGSRSGDGSRARCEHLQPLG